MTVDVDSLQAELMQAQSEAAHWEVIARRCTDGARSASKGAERLQRRVGRLKDEVKILRGRIERLQHECSEQGKKISRLSLELLSKLSQEKQHPQRG